VREQFAAISAMAPGTTIGFGAQVQPCMGLVSFLVPKGEVQATMDGVEFVGADVGGFEEGVIVRPSRHPELVSGSMPHSLSKARSSQPSSGTEAWMLKRVQGDGERIDATVQDLAYTRSGEKGETINVAVIARQPDYLPALRAALTETAIAAWFANLAPSRVTIYDVPGIHAFNIVLEGALPGGINASQRLDAGAKGVGQRLLEFVIKAGQET
jgi:hypothetical protein